MTHTLSDNPILDTDSYKLSHWVQYPSGVSGMQSYLEARGVATQEQARLGGAAHLLNFLGSDTIEGIRLANSHYDCEMAGFSIPASEHSTASMWGKAEERAMFESYVRRFLVERKVPAGLPKLAACVADTFDVFRACEAWSSDPLKSLIQSSGGLW